MSRFRLPRIESSDAAKAIELHDQVLDRVVARRTARRVSSASQIAQDGVNEPIPAEETP